MYLFTIKIFLDQVNFTATLLDFLLLKAKNT